MIGEPFRDGASSELACMRRLEPGQRGIGGDSVTLFGFCSVAADLTNHISTTAGHVRACIS